MGRLSDNPLGTAAIVLGAVVVAACFLDWASPRRAASAIRAGLERDLQAPERPDDVPGRIGELREAYGQAGTGKPFHGVWVAVIAGLATLITMAAASLEGEARARYAETAYRVAGAIFAVGMFVVLLDAGSGLFQRKERALGLWIALAASLGAALAATFASTRLRGRHATDRAE